MPNTIALKRANTTARINTQNSQLFSLVRSGVEVMWKGGAPESERPTTGWQNSEFIMFPIIGHAKDDKVIFGGQTHKLTQHGLSRYLPWEIDCTGERVYMQQEYRAGQEVSGKNGEIITFPMSFAITKTYMVNDNGALAFSIELENKSDSPLPYSVGWHPAFKTPEGIQRLSFCYSDGAFDHNVDMPLSLIRESKGNARVFPNNNEVHYETSEFGLILLHNFGNMQVWDKGEGLVALEPVSSVSIGKLSSEEIPQLDNISGLKRLQRGIVERYSAEIIVKDKKGI